MKNLTDRLPIGLVNAFVFPAAMRLKTFEMLASMVENKKPINQCISELYARKLAKKRPEASVFLRWKTRLESGETFVDAIRDDVPATERLLIAAAGTGKEALAAGLKEAVRSTSDSVKITKLLFRELTQPVVLLCVSLAVIIIFSLKMAPDMARMLPKDKMTANTANLLSMADVIATAWIPALIGLACLIVAFFWSLDIWTGRVRDYLDQWPPYSIYRTRAQANFLIALSCLQRHGDPLDLALRQIKQISGPYLVDHVDRMLDQLRRGSSMGVALETGLIDDSLSDELYVYGLDSETFANAMHNIGQRAIVTSTDRIESQARYFGVGAYILLGFIIAGIWSTMFEMQDSMAAAANSQAVMK